MPSLPSPDAKVSPVGALLTAVGNMWDRHPLLPKQNWGQNPGHWGSDTFTLSLELLQWDYFENDKESTTKYTQRWGKYEAKTNINNKK